jgi:dolichol-phosphate mannosyltransferase
MPAPLQPRTPPKLLSLVFPVYNEAEGLPALRRAVEAWTATQPFPCEIVLVDDGSRDDSFALIQQWAADDKRVHGLSFSKNFGQQMAMTAGLSVTKGDAVVLLDADLQDPLEVIPQMITRYQEGFDIVYGQRPEREGETVFKRVTSWLFYRLMQSCVHPDLPTDTGDFRLVSRRCLDAVLRMNELHRFLRGMFAWAGFHQTAVQFKRAARQYGETKWTPWKLVRFAWNATLSFSTLPLRLITWSGFFTAGFAFCYGIFAILQKYIYHTAVQGWTGIIVTLGIIGGMILVSLGVIGDYVGRIFEEIKRRPLYIVRDDTADNREPPVS